MKTQSLHNRIMRRVYYAFAIHWATHPVTLYGAALLALGWWLKELVFVATIWQAFISQPVGDLGSFVYRLIQGADMLTLLVTVLTLLCVAAFSRQLRQLTQHRYSTFAF
jgi:hypothetical protein